MTAPTRLSYVVLDVFTTERYAGNQLAVVNLPADQALTQEQKQIIAREFNFSETVILHEAADAALPQQRRIDIFMTDMELPFAGHPTIGSACFLAESQLGRKEHPGGVIVTKAGAIPYSYDTELKTAFVDIPHDVHVHSLRVSGEEAAKAGIASSITREISCAIAMVSPVKGLTFGLIPLPSKEVLSSVKGSLDAEKLKGYGALDAPWYTGGLLGTYYYVFDGKKKRGTIGVCCRMLLKDGMEEDAATGSAAATLSAYLAMEQRINNQQNDEFLQGKEFVVAFEIEQGFDMGRPSKIQTKVVLDSESGELRVITLGGSSVQVMEGHLLI